MSDDKEGNKGTSSINDVQLGLMGFPQQSGSGLSSQDVNNLGTGTGSIGGILGNQLPGIGDIEGTSSLLAQQQALMAMTANAGGGVPENVADNSGSNNDALMDLLAKQGFGGNMGNLGNGLGGVGNIVGGQSNLLGNSLGGLSVDNSAGLLANPVLSGYGMQGGLPMGLGMGMGVGVGGLGMSGIGGLGNASLFGNTPLDQLGGAIGSANDKDEVSRENQISADAATSGAAPNPMLQQNLLMQQLLAQQQANLGGTAGSLWQQYGNLSGSDGLLGMAGSNANSYLNMLGQGSGVVSSNSAVTESGSSQRESVESGVFSGSMSEFSKNGKKARPKKPKNKPKRPLSAYNIFFRDERANILAGIPDNEDNNEENEDDHDDDAETENSKKKSGKKRKRPPHGKIGFESLAKIVGQRWKELKPDELAKYKKLADADMVRYRSEMESYVQKQRLDLESSADPSFH